MAKGNPDRPHGRIEYPNRPPRPPSPPYGFFVPAKGEVLLAAVSPHKTQAVVRLGRGSAGVTAGYGGWVLEPRPKDVALVEWEGGEPTQITIPFVIGSKRRPNGRYTEEQCRALEKLAGQGGRRRPPSMIFHSAGVIEHDYEHAKHMRWVIEDLIWDLDSVSRGAQGRRVYVEGEVVLRHYIRDETLVGLAPATKRNRDKRGQREGTERGGVYLTKQDDTLRKIARKLELTREELRDMKQLNDIRDADAKLKAGRRIKLPRRAGAFV